MFALLGFTACFAALNSTRPRLEATPALPFTDNSSKRAVSSTSWTRFSAQYGGLGSCRCLWGRGGCPGCGDGCGPADADLGLNTGLSLPSDHSAAQRPRVDKAARSLYILGGARQYLWLRRWHLEYAPLPRSSLGFKLIGCRARRGVLLSGQRRPVCLHDLFHHRRPGVLQCVHVRLCHGLCRLRTDPDIKRL